MWLCNSSSCVPMNAGAVEPMVNMFTICTRTPSEVNNGKGHGRCLNPGSWNLKSCHSSGQSSFDLYLYFPHGEDRWWSAYLFWLILLFDKGRFSILDPCKGICSIFWIVRAGMVILKQNAYSYCLWRLYIHANRKKNRKGIKLYVTMLSKTDMKLLWKLHWGYPP